MPYALGIDLGTTFTAAALVRDGQLKIVELGGRAAVVPSVLFLGTDDTILAGDAAVRRAATDPSRVAREFKRRIGDPAAILLGGSPWSPEALVARMLRWTVDAVSEREGERPNLLAVSHPANWGDYKKDLLHQAIRLADLQVHLTITEPEAAAISYAATERVAPGTVVAVYDLGGGTFDAAVLRTTVDGFEILGEPQGIERLGGIDFDQAVFAFVASALDGAVEQLDPADPAAMASLSRLRQECIDAKEALSSDTEASIPVALPGLHTEVRITRGEFEAMIRPPLSDSIAALRRALRSAGVEADEVGVVLLVGGSSRVPLVAELVGNELGRPVAVDAHPKHAVAAGAALAVANASTSAEKPRVIERVPTDVPQPSKATSPVPAPPADPRPLVPANLPTPDADLSQPVVPDVAGRPASEPGSGSGRQRRRWILAAAAALVLVVVGVTVFALGGGGDPPADADVDVDEGAVPASATACPPAGTPAVCIGEVTLDSDGRLLATFTTHDVNLVAPSGGVVPDGTVHAMFFFDSIDPAGGRAWGPSSPFGDPNSSLPGFSGTDAPGASQALCVLIQDDRGRVFDGTGNCAPLPAGV